jgi:DNA-binding NtrC family response regulator
MQMTANELLTVKQRFGIIGNTPALNNALEVAMRVAPTDLSVLVTGESGVGKEFFPQVIHAYSARKHNKYIPVNCGAIPEGTIDSELFGHEKGSFTGAIESRKGYFEEADGGTIFLDEVGELPISTQVRLLRVLQTGEFMRVGSTKVQKTNVRVVAATNNDLLKAIAEGHFREDLYYRLNTVPIVVPALRERREDIYLLFRKFASDVALQYKMPPITLDEAARTMLEGHHWRGNIRQLKNVAEQISAIEQSRNITAEILRNYLPSEDYSVRTIGNNNGGNDGRYDNMNTERELLYKILFDMRSDINDLKRMMMEAMRGNVPQNTHTERREDLTTLLPALPAHPSNDINYDYDVVEEEVNEEPMHELTKEDVQREQIIKALQKHGYRRKDAANELFISERTLYRRMKALGIDDDTKL